MQTIYLTDLNAEKQRRGLRVQKNSEIKPETKKKEKVETKVQPQEINYNNVWYMVFFWLLFLKLIGAVSLSWAGVLSPIIFFCLLKIKSW